MEVVFQEQDAGVLGVIKHDQINETFIPSFKPNSHDMFYKCTFLSRPSILNWKVEDLLVDGNKAVISLSEAGLPRKISNNKSPSSAHPTG